MLKNMMIRNFPYFSCNICLTVFSDVRIVRFFAASAAMLFNKQITDKCECLGLTLFGRQTR